MVSAFSGDESVTTEFESTPPMATYLIGFVISDFISTTNELSKEPEGTLHRISVWILYTSNNSKLLLLIAFVSVPDKTQCEQANKSWLGAFRETFAHFGRIFGRKI